MQTLPVDDVPAIEPGRPAYRPFRVQVRTAQRLTPSFRQVTFAAPDLREFGADGLDQRIKLLVPESPGQLDDLGGPDWYGRWRDTPAGRRPVVRTYTVRRVRPRAGEVDVVLVDHDCDTANPGRPCGGCAPSSRGTRSSWSDRTPAAPTTTKESTSGPVAPPGSCSPGTRPPRRPSPESSSHWPPGRTSPPGRSSRCPTRPTGSRSTCRPTPAALARPGRRPARCPARAAVAAWLDGHAGLLDTVRAAGDQPLDDIDVDDELLWDSPDPTGDAFYAWMAGEAAAVKALRRAVVTDRGVDRRQVAFMGTGVGGRPNGTEAPALRCWAKLPARSDVAQRSSADAGGLSFRAGRVSGQ